MQVFIIILTSIYIYIVKNSPKWAAFLLHGRETFFAVFLATGKCGIT